jgi:predicted Zn-dependent protease
MRRELYISDEAVIKRANEAVRIELEKKKAMDVPIAVYDRKTQTIYYKNSDGSRVKAVKRLRKGRYSERIAKTT